MKESTIKTNPLPTNLLEIEFDLVGKLNESFSGKKNWKIIFWVLIFQLIETSNENYFLPEFPCSNC